MLSEFLEIFNKGNILKVFANRSCPNKGANWALQNVDNIGDLAVVECEGRIVQSDAAFKLREAVTLQGDARTVVLDLSEVNAIEGGGLGIREQLAYVLSCSKCQRILGQWTTAEDRDTELRKFAENVSDS